MTISPERQTPGEAVTAAALFFDSMIRHQIYLMRFSGSVRNELIGILNGTEREVRMSLLGDLRTKGGPTTANLRRANRIIDDIRAIRAAAFDGVTSLWASRMREMAGAEFGFVGAAIESSVPVVVNLNRPSPSLLRAMIDTMPFEGKVLSEWASTMKAQDIDRIRDQIRIGLVRGESPREIARRVLGTAKAEGRDGILQISREKMNITVRTAVNAYANAARAQIFTDNRDVFTSEVYVATLDARTTPICRALDGQQFPVGEGPMPPVHFGCRSLRVAMIGDSLVGNRPFNPTTNRRLLREYTDANGLRAVTDRSQLPRGHKGDFDAFSRRRARESIGAVPSKVTYQEWLSKQTPAFQDDVLGVAKGRLFRDGKLPLTKFVNRRGDELSLGDLARTEAGAFRAAGLDPGKYGE